MDWPVIGLWQWDAQGDLVEIEPFDEAVMFHHLPPVWTFGDEGNALAERPQTHPAPLHNWAGWPPVPSNSTPAPSRFFACGQILALYR